MKTRTISAWALAAVLTLFLSVGIAIDAIAGSGFTPGNNVNAVVSGTITAVVSGTPAIQGSLSDNGAAPSSNNIGALPAHASASAPSSTEGRLVSLWVSLAGLLHTSWDQALDKTNDSIAVSYRGRTMLTFTAAQIAGTTSDTLIASFTKNAAGATTGSVGSYVITNAATLRITSICFSNRAGAAAAVNTVFNLRYNTAGACTASSGLVGTWDIAAPSNISGDGAELCVPTGEGGLEFLGDGTGAICWSHLSSATTNVETITALGYEYTKP